ncbi:MAG: Xenobiotic-transporting ATPase [Planctomycetaceae bacterium]|nr:Xenobiotic-transporting ATPase [Planctomycetaceae bacterium]
MWATIAAWFAAMLAASILLMAYWILELSLVVGEGRPIAVSTDDYERVFGALPDQDVAAPSQILVRPGFAQVAWRNRHQPWGSLLALVERIFTRGHETVSPPMTGLLLVFAAALMWLGRRACSKWAARQRTRLELEIAGQMRSHIHRQVLRLGPADLQRTDSHGVLDLFTRDIGQIRQVLAKWLEASEEVPAQVVMFGLLALAIHPTMTFYCGVPLILYWVIQQHYRQERLTAQEVAAAHSQDELRLLSESLTRSRLVSGYGMEHAAQEHFKKYLERYQTDASSIERQWHWRTVFKGIATALCGLVVLILIVIKLTSSGTSFSLSEDAKPEAAVAARESGDHFSLAAALTLAACFVLISKAFRRWREAEQLRDEAIPAAMRVFRYLDRIPEVGQAVGAKFLQPLSRSLDLLEVSYTSPDKVVLLDRLTCSISAHRQVALISTDPQAALALASLLPRFIDPQHGQVLIDGEDIAWVTLESLRAETLFAGGPDVAFTGTVLENIFAGLSNSSLANATEAAKITHAQHFIQRLPQGYETVIGEHGEALDAGQAFRLALARAILRDPALLIIEEPSQQLDEDTKSLIDDAYQRIAVQRSVIYLPNRLATLKRCDEIILLHQGQIAARGTHAHLVKTSQLFRHWEYVRFNEFRHVVDVPQEEHK